MSKDTFAKWLSVEMESRNLSQSELARRLGINQAAISRLLSQRSLPSISTLNGLAKVFQLPIAHIYQATGLMAPDPEGDLLTEQIAHLAKQLPTDTDKQEIIEILKVKLSLRSS